MTCNFVEVGAAQFVDTFGGSNFWQSSESFPSSSSTFPKLICDWVWRRSVISSIDTLSSLGGVCLLESLDRSLRRRDKVCNVKGVSSSTKRL